METNRRSCQTNTESVISSCQAKIVVPKSNDTDEFYERARELVEDAGFTGNKADRMLRDTILGGLSDTDLRDKITRKANNDMKLEDVMRIARAEVSTRLAMQAMNTDVKPAVRYLSYDKRHSKGNRVHKGHQNSSQSIQQNGKFQNQQSDKGEICYRCGKGKHQPRQKCGAADVTCNKCGRKGHYARICQSKCQSGSSQGSSGSGAKPKRVNLVQEIPPDSPAYFDENGAPVYQTHMVRFSQPQSIVKSRDDLVIQFPIGTVPGNLDCKIMLQCDTGCDVNCMNEVTFKKLFPDSKLQGDPSILENYGSRVDFIGTSTTFIRWKGQVWKQKFYVTKANQSPNLLCRPACFAMEILKRNFSVQLPKVQLPKENFGAQKPKKGVQDVGNSKDTTDDSASSKKEMPVKGQTSSKLHSIIPESVTERPLTKDIIVEKYKDCFEGLGTFPGEPYRFRLKPDAVPVKHGIRKVPLHLKDAFHQEIKDLVK